MESKTQTIIDYASRLNLGGIKEQLPGMITTANEEKSSYTDFALRLLQIEIDHRSKRDLERRIKTAKLPLKYELDHYDFFFYQWTVKTAAKPTEGMFMAGAKLQPGTHGAFRNRQNFYCRRTL